MKLPTIISGGSHSDERGKVSFVNDFEFGDIKRFYIIEHPDTDTVRAWQAHQKEEKWFYVVSGQFLIAWVKIDNWESPDINLKADHKILQSTDNNILYVPPGYANGFMAIEPNSRVIVFSNFTLEESAGDNFRFNKDLWFSWLEFKSGNIVSV